MERINAFRKIERIVKRLVLTFIIFTLLYIIVLFISPAFNDLELFHIKIHVPIYFLFSIFFVAKYFGKELNIFKFLFLEEADNDDLFYRILNNIGIFSLYFMFQLCLVVYFFPSFAEKTLWNVPLFLPLFIANSYLLTSFYSFLYEEKFSLKRAQKIEE